MVNPPQNDSRPEGSVAGRAATSQFVEFEADGRRYAFRIEQIREIVILKDITPTPQVAPHIEGVSNLRGAIIPIVNLRVLFGLPRKPTDDATRTIVVRVGDRTVGCTVDTVTRVIRVSEDQIQPAPSAITNDGGGYIDGFAKVDDRLVVILDVDRLLNIEQMQKNKYAQPPGMITDGEI